MQKTVMLALLLACGFAQAESIPLIREHGTFVVPVVINDKLTLNFTIDSGASDVSIPTDVFSTLTRTGTVTKSDFLDTQVYELADGSKQTSQRFRIRSLRIGNLELRNVIASVAPSAGSLLLGQSFLSRLKSWSIDNGRQLLVFDESTHSYGPPSAVKPKLRTGTRIAETPSSSPITTDLHAAYCTEVIRNLIGEAESMLSEENSYSTVPNVDDTAAVRTAKAKLEAENRKLKAGFDSNQNRLSRLNRHLRSRLNYPDILAAQKAGKNDIARLNALATSEACSECMSSYLDHTLDNTETTKCVNECSTRVMPDYPSIQNKRQSCHNLEWLPF